MTKTARQAEAQATKSAVQAESNTSDYRDRQLLGTADWYVVRNGRGKYTERRQRDLKPTDVVCAGPYYTKDQANCERGEGEYMGKIMLEHNCDLNKAQEIAMARFK